MELKDIVLIILVLAVIYLIYKTNTLQNINKENFDLTNDSIRKAVNDQYKEDIDSIRNLAGISKKIMTDNNLTLPTTLKAGVIKPFDNATPYRVTVEARELAINGNLQLDGTAGMCISDRCYSATQIHFLPRGSIIAYFDKTGSIPGGWALCDGKFYKSVDGKLSQVVDKSDPLAVETPDLRGRFILGYGKTENRANSYEEWGSQSYDKEYNFVHGETGGEFKHKLVVNEMPSHGHGMGGAINSSDVGSGYHDNVYRTRSGYSTDHTGGDDPHNNMPPYYALYYIMRIA